MKFRTKLVRMTLLIAGYIGLAAIHARREWAASLCYCVVALAYVWELRDMTSRNQDKR